LSQLLLLLLLLLWNEVAVFAVALRVTYNARTLQFCGLQHTCWGSSAAR